MFDCLATWRPESVFDLKQATCCPAQKHQKRLKERSGKLRLHFSHLLNGFQVLLADFATAAQRLNRETAKRRAMVFKSSTCSTNQTTVFYVSQMTCAKTNYLESRSHCYYFYQQKQKHLETKLNNYTAPQLRASSMASRICALKTAASTFDASRRH